MNSTYVTVAIQAENTKWLLDSIVVHAQRYSPSIAGDAQRISRKFSVAFELFSKCHSVYDGFAVSDADIDNLGKQ